MARRLDEDLRKMTPAQLRQEVMRLRTAFRRELNGTGNRRCWVTLLEVLPEGEKVKPLSLPRDVFLANCARYHKRNQ